MLEIIIPSREFYDERREVFVNSTETSLQLEHSLISISKWEAKWCKPFLSNKEKTYEESIDYISCMTLTKNVDPNVYYYMTSDLIRKIKEYIDAPMTATWFNDGAKGKKKHRGPSEVITAEIIYYWMISLNIPIEFQKWHLNRLLTLIRVCSIKNAPPKKMSKNAIAQQYKSINAARRKSLNSMG